MMKYIFCIIALLIQPVFSWYVYHKQDKKKAALKMPMLYYSVAYMVVQLYVFFKFCSKFPERYSIYSYLIQAAILLGFVIFEMILWGSNKYIEDVDNKEKQSIQDFKELIKDLEICRVNVQDTASKANIDKLYERMRYENPVSSPKAIEENLRIKGLIAELADITDNTLFEAKCNEIVKQLDIRKIKNTNEVTKVTSGNALSIPTDELSENAEFYPVDVDGTEMEVIAVKDSTGTIRTAFNTCQICYDSGKGYYKQEGDKLVCQNCGNSFTMDQVGEISRGCDPWPILDENKTVTDEEIEISYDFLKASADIFANWKKA